MSHACNFIIRYHHEKKSKHTPRKKEEHLQTHPPRISLTYHRCYILMHFYDLSSIIFFSVGQLLLVCCKNIFLPCCWRQGIFLASEFQGVGGDRWPILTKLSFPKTRHNKLYKKSKHALKKTNIALMQQFICLTLVSSQYFHHESCSAINSISPTKLDILYIGMVSFFSLEAHSPYNV